MLITIKTLHKQLTSNNDYSSIRPGVIPKETNNDNDNINSYDNDESNNKQYV